MSGSAGECKKRPEMRASVTLDVAKPINARAAGTILANAAAYFAAMAAVAAASQFNLLPRDCASCPEMVVVPAGAFVMGSPEGEPERGLNEAEVKISIVRPFAVGRFAVTFEEWDACTAEGGCNGYRPADEGWGRGRRPVVNVSWHDASDFAAWLSGKAGKRYRLLSESEREYVARAGSATAFWWGTDIDVTIANIDVPVTRTDISTNAARRRTVEVDDFAPNRWGLFNVHGNVWEWTADCWVEDNTLHPADGSPLSSGDCARRAARGGSWNDFGAEARAAARFGFDASSRNNLQGFRVARDLD